MGERQSRWMRGVRNWLRRDKRETQPVQCAARDADSRAAVLRVMTYNVHSCVGMDRKLSTSRIASVIARCDADIVALQELDVRRARTGAIDQAHAIAEELKMTFHFHPALKVEEEQYGDAILSRLPMDVVRAGPLPGLSDRPRLEPRGALWVRVQFGGEEVHVINTHLGLVARERWRQSEALMGDTWLGHSGCRGPVILCGDFNALPRSKVCRHVCSRLKDAQLCVDGHKPKNTFFSRFPIGRIDHVFVSPDFHVVSAAVLNNKVSRVASDHLPLVVELRLPGAARDGALQHAQYAEPR